MYAIINKHTKKFVSGTDRRQFYSATNTFKQILSFDQALTYECKEYADMDIMSRRMSKDYKVVEVKLTVIG